MEEFLFFIAGAVVGVAALLGWQYQMYRKHQRAQAAFTDGDYGSLKEPLRPAGPTRDPSCIDPTD
jgi:hypothetical protein